MNRETIEKYLDGLLNNKLVTWDGPGVYVKYERRNNVRVTLGTDALSVFEQERMHPSEWYQTEMPYNELTLQKLRSRLGS